MESAELVRVDLTRSLGVLVSICFLGGGLATSLGLHCCEPEGERRGKGAISTSAMTYYDERSVWTWAMYEAPPVLNLNLRGLFSSTDLMSLAAAGAEPAIVRFVWDGGGDRLV